MLALSPSEVHVFRSHREEPEKSPSTFLPVHRQFVGLPFPKDPSWPPFCLWLLGPAQCQAQTGSQELFVEWKDS